MNITAIRLVFVGTNTGFVAMCKILLVVIKFLKVHTLILISLAVIQYCSS